MMTGQIFFSPDKPRFWPIKLMNIIITLLPMEYRITLAVRHCRSSFCRQVGEKFIHTLLSSFPRFSPVLCPFIYTFSIIVRRCRKSPRFVLYLHIGESWSFSLPGTWSKVSSTKKNFVAKYLRQRSWFSRNLFHKQGIRHQKSINIQESFRLGRRATLFANGLSRRRILSTDIADNSGIESANEIMFDEKKFYN